MASPIKHVFVLMLENRSFDHMFGRSGLTGIDAETGAPTTIDGLPPDHATGAPYEMPTDPHHEFPDVYLQLTGNVLPNPSAFVPPYPPITLSGFEQSYKDSGGADASLVMRPLDTATNLPVLHALAQEYAICDGWFASSLAKA